MRRTTALLAVLASIALAPSAGSAKDIFVGAYTATDYSTIDARALRTVGLYPIHLQKYLLWKDVQNPNSWQQAKIAEWGAKIEALGTMGPSTTDPVFADMDAAIQSGIIEGGDRIVVGSGSHGRLLIRDFNPQTPVHISAASGADAHVEYINILRSSNLVIRGLKVWPTVDGAGAGAVIRTDRETNNVTFVDLDVRSTANADKYMTWSLNDWLNNKRNGALLYGTNVHMKNSKFTGMYMGIEQVSTNGLVEDNHVEGFAGDGMRALADGATFRGNRIENCFKINNNHDDGIQSFTRDAEGKVGTGKGTLSNMVIENNMFLEWTSKASHPLRCKLQGISMFDGMYHNITIQNNVINISAYHGITMLGAIDSTIRHNTVTHALNVKDRYPWIRIGNHKLGMPSKNVVIANNLSNRIVPTTDPFYKVVVEGNYEVASYLNDFVDAASKDYRIKTTSLAVDFGLPSRSNEADFNGDPRPLGNGPDAGAFEVR